MIKISRKERDVLEKDYNLRFNQDIHATYTKHRTYYMTETDRNLRIINKIRSN